MKPQKEDTSVDYTTDIDIFYQILAQSRGNNNKIKNLLKDLLTPTEILMLNRRWHVARLINQGKSIREVAKLSKVGTDTVVRISKKINEGSGELKNALNQSQKKWQIATNKTKKTKLQGKKTLNKWVYGSTEG